MKTRRLFQPVATWVKSQSAERIAIPYAIFGASWILFSDSIAKDLVTMTEIQLTTIQTAKGWVFVAISTLVIFGVVEARDRTVSANEQHLRRQSQYLQVFNRVLRHNVRNELNVIGGRVEEAEEHCEGEAELLDDLDAIRSATDRILRVSEKARKIDRFDPNVRPEPVDVVSKIETLVGDVRERYPQSTITLTLPGAVYIRTTDTILLALEELIENAIEHNDRPPQGREVKVEVESTFLSTATITVADNGPGLPDREIVPLEEGKEDPTRHASSIGLWLVQWVVDDHRGELAIESTEEGTAVSITIPKVALRQAREEIMRGGQ